MIKAFPKIFALGTDYISDIFQGSVEISEKIDGSQFGFGKINGELFMRSKGKLIIPDAPEKMFTAAVEYILSIEHLIPNKHIFHCEYLNRAKHNVLAYERIPKNGLMLFSAIGPGGTPLLTRSEYAEMFEIEPIPVLYEGEVSAIEEIQKLLETESILGGQKVEGIVVKNYNQPFLLGGQPIRIMCGKLVSEKFKEKHQKDWKANSKVNRFDQFKECFRTEARWNKAIQHLRECDKLENDPRDIGKLIKEVHQDIIDEEEQNIKNFLFSMYVKEILRKATAGLPEWYKEQLLKRNFD